MSGTDWLAFGVNLAAAGVARGSPILFAAVGEIVTERAGVLNLGVEGMMLVGAMTGYAVGFSTGSAWIGLVAGALAGAALSLLHALVAVGLKADQVVSGLALTFVGTGASAVLGAPLVASRAVAPRLPDLTIPGLARIPVLGPVLFRQNVVVYLAFLAVLAAWAFFRFTRLGLAVRAVGEHPAAADSLGVRVSATRTACVAAGGALAGMGGASLSLAITPGWVEGMTAGQGWIAVGLVIFAGWDPIRAAAGACLFGAIRRLPLDLQGIAELPWLGNPRVGFFLDMLPYVFTVVVLVVASSGSLRRRFAAPGALGVPYVRGEKGG